MQKYDPNGNLTSDMNKSIFKIEYNFLNLPVQIFFNNGAKIKILYDAAGTKLRKTYTDQNNNVTTQDYDGGIEYYDQVLNMIPHPEGRVAVIKKDDRLTYRYEYVITDHLGNARVTFADVNEDQVIGIEEIIQENHYYPFGLDMQGAWTPPAGEWNRHKYNGKDWNKEEALNWYDYGARWYDPAVGRWWSVDPLAEKRNWLSPYQYVQNNPVRRVDPDGALDGDIYNLNGVKIGSDGQIDNKAYRANTYLDNQLTIEESKESINMGFLVTEPIDVRNGTPTVDLLNITNEQLNMNSMLATIRITEGYGEPLEYNAQYGNRKFNNNYKDHPRQSITAWGGTSNAAGAYQFLASTWDSHAKALGLKDFSPRNQDRAAIKEISLVKGATELIYKGDYKTAIVMLNRKWTSLPGGSQAWNGFSFNIFLEQRANELIGKSILGK